MVLVTVAAGCRAAPDRGFITEPPWLFIPSPPFWGHKELFSHQLATLRSVDTIRLIQVSGAEPQRDVTATWRREKIRFNEIPPTENKKNP